LTGQEPAGAELISSPQIMTHTLKKDTVRKDFFLFIASGIKIYQCL
jgi:hypothetical protein